MNFRGKGGLATIDDEMIFLVVTGTAPSSLELEEDQT